MKNKISFLFIFCISITACKKQITNNNNNDGNNGGDDTTTITVPQDPAIANTIGFFMNEWQGKNFTAPSYIDTIAALSGNVIVTIDASTILTKISPALFGNNANLWMTQFVAEPSLIKYITDLKPHIIRFPGGSISDVFFWNEPNNTKPADAPDSLENSDGIKSPAYYWYGKNTDSWTCSVDNYYNMLQQTGNEGMITINYAYARYSTAANPVAAAAHLAADWVRYDNGRTKYWEIGNEDGGTWEASYRIDLSTNKDGQPEIINGDLYGSHFKVFADSMRQAATEIGKQIYIGEQLLGEPPASWATETDKNWNSGVLTKAGNDADYFIIHDYFTPYATNSSTSEILSSAASVPPIITNYLNQCIQSASVSTKPIALTEWNISAQGSQQMVSDVSGIHAVLVENELIKNKFGMASRWDLANGWNNGDDQGMFSQGGEPNIPQWNPRPAFYYLYFLQKFLGDRCINASVTGSNHISAYASTFTSGEIGVTLVNQSSSIQTIKLTYKNFIAGKRFYWYTLTTGNDNGQFSKKVYVNGQGTTLDEGGPANYSSIKPYSASTANGIYITLPPLSVVYTAVDKK